MPEPRLREFLEDVVRVSRGRETGFRIEQIAEAQVRPMTLSTWLRQAGIDEGTASRAGFERDHQAREGIEPWPR